MISYEELCQALDRYNNRLQNENEMARLNEDSESYQPVETPAQEDGLAAAAAFAEEVGAEYIVGSSDAIPAAELASQPAEDTHEIDVDDMFEDDKGA